MESAGRFRFQRLDVLPVAKLAASSSQQGFGDTSVKTHQPEGRQATFERCGIAAEQAFS
jgi:hypothetical protein